MYAYLSRKYYDMRCSLLKTTENCKIRNSICIPEQRKVRIDRHVFIIRTCLLNVDVVELLYKLMLCTYRWFATGWRRGGGGGGGNPGEILTFQVFKCQFPTIRSPLEVKLCCCRKYPYPSHGRFFYIGI